MSPRRRKRLTVHHCFFVCWFVSVGFGVPFCPLGKQKRLTEQNTKTRHSQEVEQDFEVLFLFLDSLTLLPLSSSTVICLLLSPPPFHLAAVILPYLLSVVCSFFYLCHSCSFMHKHTHTHTHISIQIILIFSFLYPFFAGRPAGVPPTSPWRHGLLRESALRELRALWGRSGELRPAQSALLLLKVLLK